MADAESSQRVKIRRELWILQMDDCTHRILSSWERRRKQSEGSHRTKTGLAIGGFEDGRGPGAKECGQPSSRGWNRRENRFSPIAFRKGLSLADPLVSA